ncbi:MAG TPA: EamA family transporter RarD [Alphaproteobacteria bacterium]|nr:EamA family transporter RarD [Alphaproteobacteria bacterium]
MSRNNDNSTGLAAAAGAYLLWGGLPLYLKALTFVPAPQIMMHRIVWSFVILLPALLLPSIRRELVTLLRQRRRALMAVGTALCLAANWLIFIWAVVNGHALEAGLGYFICPLFNVVLGAVVLRERLKPLQVAAVVVVALGVAWLTFASGRLPWIALTLALTFGLYGLGKKTLMLSAPAGLFVDTLLLMPAVLVFWAVEIGQGADAFTAGSAGQKLAMMAAGPLTSIPLLLYATAANRLKLATLGLLQYLNPTCQVVLAVFVFGETFTSAHAVSFGAIWLGLLLYFFPEPAALRRRRGRSDSAGN